MSEYTAEMAHAAVARGAAWLDKRCPTWASEIDISKLDLGNGDVCILGQTATCLVGEPGYRDSDGYNRTARYFWPTSDRWPVRLGFEKPIDNDLTAYEMLTIAWRTLIKERLAK